MRLRPSSSATSVWARRDLPGIDDLKAAGLLDPLEEAMFSLQLESDEEEV
jgi:segregation and condensation protein B